MNIRLLIEYDGADFCGWQRQVNGPSIQEHIETVIERTTGRRSVVYGASRTDSGVHAAGQVANFETDSTLTTLQWTMIFNFHLPAGIRVLESTIVPPKFHAQKAASGKLYEYCVLNRAYTSALNRRVYFLPRPLHWGRIREALPQFLGEHDFRAFQGAKADVRSTVRTLNRLTLSERGDGFFAFQIAGNGFLKQMVRTIIGTLVEIGLGKRDIGDVEKIIQSQDRQRAGHTAPACGLTLVRVFYPGD